MIRHGYLTIDGMQQFMISSASDQDLTYPHWIWEVIDRAPERIHVIDQNGQIIYGNQYRAESAEPLRIDGRNIFDFILPAYQDLARLVMQTVLSSKKSGSFEAAFSFDQAERWYQTFVIPLNPKSNFAPEIESHRLALFHRDAAPTWAAHEAIKQRTNELEKRLEERNQILEEYTRYLDAGGKLNIQLTQLNNVSMVLQTLAELAKKAMNSGFSAIYRVDKDWIEYAAGVKSPVILHKIESLSEDGILGRLLNTNNMKFIEHLDERIVQNFWRGLPRDFNIHSLLIVPVVCKEAFRGILYLGYERPAPFNKENELVLRASIEATIDTLHRIHVVQQLERNIQTREQEISVLYDLSTFSSEPVELDDLIHKSLRRIMTASKCETGLFFWNNQERAHTDMVACWPQTGIPGPVKQFLHQAEPLKGPGQIDAYSLQNLEPDNTLACITVPVNSKGKPGCYLRLFGDPENLHRAEVVHLTISAARQLGLSIDSALDRQLAKEVVVLEERQRMARNLHDSITQSLYALCLSSDVALKAFDRSEGDQLRAALDDITSSSLQALKEMRLMLFELRPAALEKAGLIGALELRLNTVERRSGMEASLECSGNINIPESLELELYSIISEALNNSLRHSGARSIWVRIRSAVHMISVEVEDNGKGFELGSINQGGMGLTSMNERARKLGGNLTVYSKEGKGTRISFKVRTQGEI